MKTLVIHPTRLKERGEHLDRMLRNIGLEYDIVNEGSDEAKIKAYLKKSVNKPSSDLKEV